MLYDVCRRVSYVGFLTYLTLHRMKSSVGKAMAHKWLRVSRPVQVGWWTINAVFCRADFAALRYAQ